MQRKDAQVLCRINLQILHFQKIDDERVHGGGPGASEVPTKVETWEWTERPSVASIMTSVNGGSIVSGSHEETKVCLSCSFCISSLSISTSTLEHMQGTHFVLDISVGGLNGFKQFHKHVLACLLFLNRTLFRFS